ncbi:hypothetical protein OIU84_018733 [Salix udensis]|uniref:Uncharacterized protein n=1 Tax=Salix udensis TaxID=889485 RepID=A0AAD6KX53_9ROSI|nr:hypothetical protein OIU84_018733 [Salix udensis]
MLLSMAVRFTFANPTPSETFFLSLENHNCTYDSKLNVYSSLAKKLQPANKASKRFTNTLESKLHDLNFPEAPRLSKLAPVASLLIAIAISFFPSRNVS